MRPAYDNTRPLQAALRGYYRPGKCLHWEDDTLHFVNGSRLSLVIILSVLCCFSIKRAFQKNKGILFIFTRYLLLFTGDHRRLVKYTPQSRQWEERECVWPQRRDLIYRLQLAVHQYHFIRKVSFSQHLSDFLIVKKKHSRSRVEFFSWTNSDCGYHLGRSICS